MSALLYGRVTRNQLRKSPRLQQQLRDYSGVLNLLEEDETSKAIDFRKMGAIANKAADEIPTTQEPSTSVLVALAGVLPAEAIAGYTLAVSYTGLVTKGDNGTKTTNAHAYLLLIGLMALVSGVLFIAGSWGTWKDNRASNLVRLFIPVVGFVCWVALAHKDEFWSAYRQKFTEGVSTEAAQVVVITIAVLVAALSGLMTVKAVESEPSR